MDLTSIAESTGQVIEGIGVLVIALGALVALARFAADSVGRAPGAYLGLRQNLGKAVLLGLEFLVAGDIIRTVAVDPTFRSLGVLAGIVAIRTFLSVALEVELSGRWPWDRKPDAG